MIEGRSKVGTVNVIFDSNPEQTDPPMRKRLDFRQLVPRNSPIMKPKGCFWLLQEDRWCDCTYKSLDLVVFW